MDKEAIKKNYISKFIAKPLLARKVLAISLLFFVALLFIIKICKMEYLGRKKQCLLFTIFTSYQVWGRSDRKNLQQYKKTHLYYLCNIRFCLYLLIYKQFRYYYFCKCM
jgi:hypothetical protein